MSIAYCSLTFGRAFTFWVPMVTMVPRESEHLSVYVTSPTSGDVVTAAGVFWGWLV